MRSLYSIGHSSHPIDHLLKLLRSFQIQVVVDSRSQPHSRYAPQFNFEALKSALLRDQIDYLFLGKELGGRPEKPEFYDKEGYVLYWRVASSPEFRKGLARLVKEATKRRVAVLCSEEDPSSCHRRLLIGRVLTGLGVKMNHIRGNGALQTEMDLARDSQDRTDQSLFSSPRNMVWKSIRSVLQRSQPQTSSEH
jgi:uncharacterized protein (DUF488 family)